MLEVDNLAVERGDRTLFTGLSFSLEQGELLYVNGPNGSGKTTLLRMLTGLVAAQDGEVRWNGTKIGVLGDEYRKELIYLGHLAGLKDELSGLENLQIATTLDGRCVSKDSIQAALQRMGLDGYEDLPAKVLSAGQKRRVALARLLLSDARIWILDEPFTALDVTAIEELSAIFSGHLSTSGMLVLTTHQTVAIDAATVKQIKLGS